MKKKSKTLLKKIDRRISRITGQMDRLEGLLMTQADTAISEAALTLLREGRFLIDKKGLIVGPFESEEDEKQYCADNSGEWRSARYVDQVGLPKESDPV